MNKFAAFIVLSAGVIWLVPSGSPTGRTDRSVAPVEVYPEALIVDAPGDEAVRQFLQNYAALMYGSTGPFLDKVKAGKYHGNAAQAARDYHALSEDARKAAQSEIKRRSDKLQDNPAAITKYIEESRTGWEQAARSLSK
jgi:hypothetical protein